MANDNWFCFCRSLIATQNCATYKTWMVTPNFQIIVYLNIKLFYFIEFTCNQDENNLFLVENTK